MPFFTTPDQCRLYVKTFGPETATEAVVFLNGLSQTTLYWHAHARKIADRYRVVCYDARAQGRSDIGGLPLALGRHAEDLEALLDHLAISRAVLVGLSHGAYVACAFAAARGARTAGLVLSGAADRPENGHLTMVDAWQRALTRGGLPALARRLTGAAFGKAFADRYRRLMPIMEKSLVVRNRFNALAAQLEALHRYPPLSDFANAIDVPALVLWGTEDRMVNEAGARRIAERLKATFIPLAGIGHSLPVEAPGAFQGHLADFLLDLGTWQDFVHG